MNPVYNKICMGLGITLGFFPGVGFGAQIPKPWLGEDATYAAIATSSAAVTEGQASKDSRFLLDLASIAEINGVAQTLWKQMAACQMGAPLGIRQAYLENKWSCKNPEKKNLVNSIFAFHEEVQAFLRTSLFLEGDYFRIFQKETVADLSLKLHPLVVESVWESLALQPLYWMVDYRRSRAPLDSEYSQYLLHHWNLLRVLSESDCSAWGLWPAGALSLSYSWSSSERYLYPGETHLAGSLAWSYVRSSARLDRACGRLSHLPEPYFQKWYSVSKIYREVACQYRKSCR